MQYPVLNNWLTTQAAANRSPARNSLLSGKKQAISRNRLPRPKNQREFDSKFGVLPKNSLRNGTRNCFCSNGEFCTTEQGMHWVEALRTRKSGPCSISSGRLSMSVGKTSKHSGNRRLRTSAMGPTAPELCPAGPSRKAAKS